MAWTEQQEAAITTRDCGLIVSAAAGSGKTSVLVERLLRILMEEDPEKRVPADRMIVVTFTNDAAAEMKTRLYQALDLQIEQHPENKWLYKQQILLQSALPLLVSWQFLSSITVLYQSVLYICLQNTLIMHPK